MASSRVNPLPTHLITTARSQSPGRPAVPNYQTIDPLLGNLSPESTLQALSSTDAVPRNEQVAHDILSKSISQVSPAERALGIRAAVAAQKLNLWYKEVQSWDWPKRTDAHLGKGFVPPSGAPDDEYCGSLPVAVVDEHEKRIEEIRDGLEVLDVDELKEHVLNAHIPARSRPSSSNSTLSVPPPLSYVQLSDFTAVITATILRALPLLSRLNSLLATWDVRLLVLRQIPELLRRLRLARSELDSALGLLKSPTLPGETDPLYSRSNYHAKRAILEATVVSAGRQLDRVLDALEGREDSLPESWIDDLEGIESEFGTWVMEAERRTVENEWRMTISTDQGAKQDSPRDTSTQPSHEIRDPEKLSLTTSGSVPQTSHLFPMETIAEEESSPTEPSPSIEAPAEQIIAVPEPIVAPASHNANPNRSSPSSSATTDASDNLISNSEPIIALQKDSTPTSSILAFTTNALNEVDDLADEPRAIESASPKDTQPTEALENKIIASASDESPLEEYSPERDSPLLVEEQVNASLPSADLHETPLSLQEDATPRASLDIQSEEVETCRPFQFISDAPVFTPKKERTDPMSLLHLDESSRHSSPANSLQPPASPDAPSSDAGSVIVRRRTSMMQSPLSQQRGVSEDDEATLFEVDSANPVIETSDERQPASVEHQTPSLVSDTVQAVSTEAPSVLDSFPVLPINASPKSPTKPIISDSDRQSSTFPTSIAHEETNDGCTSKKPLESPIKLSKTRPERLYLEQEKSKSRGRRTSDASSLSDYPSLVSSPEVHEPQTSSSDGTPLLLETPPPFHEGYQSSDPIPPGSDHTLREDRLFRLDNQKPSPRANFAHNRNLSLPLQRFINERLEMNYEDESGSDLDGPSHNRKSTDVYADLRLGQKRALLPPHNGRSSISTNIARRSATQILDAPREESPRPISNAAPKVLSKAWEHRKSSAPKHANRSALKSEPPAHSTTTRLRRQLTAHPSLESIGAYRSNGRSSDEASSVTAFSKPGSRPSTPGSQLRKPRDHLDEKITSILSTLPTRIHLMSADEKDFDLSSVATSIPLKARERFRSISPQGTPSRSSTPTPSLTLTPAPSRRRYSHAHAPEESSVKLYHLHRGGKSAPTKLFVRSVGESGERVMVRVGGGWADLGEYLREYAIHHGRRHVSDTPRVEVQGLTTRTSPTYSASGRRTPSRPRSVISNRPSSSLAMRKTRRTSNVSDVTEFRAGGEMLNASYSPISTVSSRRRLSASSNASMGAASSASEFRHGSSCSPSTTAAGGSSHSIPLGLAGPKPRPRHVTISPESEAWVEDVLGQARRSSSLRPYNYVPPQDQEPASSKAPTIPKSRSISDLGMAGSSRRVALRGLAKR
ncbi:hypothetical protein BO94DRAFT_587663 [Aspergillus sclerotioniger CBS 115572]|uniref:GAR domain-containing protein n=1 Tax=Aspergillus sclerotioniger CBS 115572 TaxID=1450535 RepID=A0A317W300_9EURO|nr:hypothetical protein BO94DRAFT_587663 [Aspergillus sclerotioniger CBS 115572]PWY80924.1 hypothetical protein BO94DRAFT_587663 [Aspergillus sclerotioniger CBS 115572]